MDAATRHDEIDVRHLAASLGHLHELLSACKSGDPAQIDQALDSSTCEHPDGRFLAARALSEGLLRELGLGRTEREGRDIADEDFLAMLPTWAGPLFGGTVDDYASRQAAAREFLLAYLREDFAAQFALTDRHEDVVLHALAELLSHQLLPAEAKPAWVRRLEAIPIERMLGSAPKYAALLAAACRRVPAEVIASIAVLVGGDPDERWLLAHAMATGITVDMGLEHQRGKVPPSGPQVFDLLVVPPPVVLGDAGTRHHRMIITRRFLACYLGDDYAAQMELCDKHGDLLMLGLVEWAAAVHPEAVDAHDH